MTVRRLAAAAMIAAMSVGFVGITSVAANADYSWGPRPGR